MQFMETLRQGKPTNQGQLALRRCFGDIAAKLKPHAIRAKGRQPWYFILGQPQSGKTTLLRHETDSNGHKVGSYLDADGNFNSDWWLSGNAVIVDLGGPELLAEDRGSGNWSHFVELLPRHRRTDAPSIAIIVISCTDLLDSNKEHQTQQARILRQRLRELQQISHHDIPCYLVVSKCDSLSGFCDYFATMTPDERQQIWGATLKSASRHEELSSQLASLSNALHCQLPQRLQSERNALCRRGMAALPSRFDTLRTRVVEFASILLPPSHGQESPFLRGVYFAAATQSGRYFTDRLFNEVILADPQSSRPLSRDRGSILPMQRIATITIISIAVTLLLAWTSAFVVQQKNMDETRQLLDRHMLDNSFSGDDGSAMLSRADDTLIMLEKAMKQQQQANWTAMLGMRDISLQKAVESRHAAELNQQWLPALSEHLLRQLAVHNDNPDTQFDALKAWLMLVDPTHREMKYLTQWLDSTNALDDAQRDTVTSRILELHRRDPQFLVPGINMSAVEPLQQRLAARSPLEHIYEKWKAQFANKVFALKPQLGMHADTIFSTGDQRVWNIPALYTAEVFQQLRIDADMPELRQLEQDQWVLGDAAYVMDEALRAHIASALRQRYAGDYIAAWQNLFNALSVRRNTGSASLLNQLQILSNNDTSPLALLLRIAEENLRTLSQGQVSIAVAPDRIAAMTATLADLQNWLNNVYHADDIGSAALQTAAGTSVEPTPARRTLIMAEALPAPVSGWVASLARTASNTITGTASGSLESAWREQVARFCQAHIGNRYPFEPRAVRAADFNDFVEYFKPGGIEDNFVRTHLGKTIDRRSWTAKTGAPTTLPERTIRMFAQAQKIRSAFFYNAEPGFSYRITAQRMSANLQRFSMDAGNAHFEYSHGPRQASLFHWPQDPASLSVQFTSLRGSSVTRNHEGVWGLFRLIDAAQVVHDGGNATRLLFHEGSQDVELSMVSAGSLAAAASTGPGATVSGNPLQRHLLSDYDCLPRLR